MPNIDEVLQIAQNKGASTVVVYLSNSSKDALVRGARFRMPRSDTYEVFDYVTGEVLSVPNAGQYLNQLRNRFAQRESSSATYFRAFMFSLYSKSTKGWIKSNYGVL